MKAGWEYKKFREVCELKKGKKPQLYSEIAADLKPYLVAKYLRGGIATEFASVGDKNSIKVTTQDVIIICDGSNSGETFIGFEGVLSSTMAKVVHGSCIQTKFLIFYLESLFEKFNESKTGSAIPHLDLAGLREELIPIPPKEEQHRIVAILDEAFAEIATAKANAEKNLQNARTLFESYLNSVEGERSPLGLFVDIKTGKLDANAAKDEGQYPFFTCAREIYSIDTFAFDQEAILLAGNNAVGDFNVKHYKGKFNAYQRTYVISISATEKMSYRFLYFQMLKSLRHFKEQSVGAGTKFLKLDMIKDLEIAVPTLNVQSQIALKLDGMLEQTQHLESLYQQKLAALDELKKSLLHQAFSGQL